MTEQPHTVYQSKRRWEFDLILSILDLCECLDYSAQLRQLRIAREDILQFKKKFIHLIPRGVIPDEIAVLKDRELDLNNYVKNMKDTEPVAIAYLKINKQELEFVRQEMQLYRSRLVFSEITSSRRS